ncbi:MAG: TrbC/VirB2 family protein [Sedimenticola sp.]
MNTAAQSNQTKNGKSFLGKVVMAMAIIFVVTIPELALAAPWDGPLQNFIDLLTGTTARLFAILALIILGFMAMTGRMAWGHAGSVIAGLVLIFGAAWIADNFISAV